VHLYLNEELSSYQIARRTGIAPSTVRRKLKKLGISRNHREATRIQQQARFTCRLCGKSKPISELVMDRRYFPPIPCCKKCAGY